MERRSVGHPIDTGTIKEIWDLNRIPVRFLKGVGPKNAEKLLRLGIEDAGSLLFHRPVAYQDRRCVTPLAKTDPEKSQSFVVKLGAVREMRSRTGRRIVRAQAYDETGQIDLVWFTFPRYLRALLQPHKEYLVYGKAEFFRGAPQITHPEIVPWDESSALPGHLLPLYPLTAGITHAYLRKIIRSVLEEYEQAFTETFPRHMQETLSYPGLKKAFWDLHFPTEEADAVMARRRLAFDELFFFNLIMQKRKEEKSRVEKTPYRITEEMREQFLKSLPFTLTDSQKQVMGEIEGDIAGPHLMYRLLQGDVGCGKTVLAAFALYCAVINGRQGAFMAPTGVLARQHYDNLTRYLAPLGIETVLITGGMSKGEKETALAKCASGESRVVIGTHALLYDSVEFSALDMVVIDEQHKFGVAQRKSLQLKGTLPHYLLMTATPIPRTTLMVWFGDVEISVISALPGGRGGIKTALRPESSRKKVYEFARKELNEGKQAYAVYPLVEDSDKSDLRSAETMYKEISAAFGPEHTALLHGKMKAEEKMACLRKFKEKRVQFLVTTTVIEVGIDVPDATLMIIEHPERFGLAQLHQLRGRIGRGPHPSYCVLLTDPGLSAEAAERLEQFASTNDGFAIAELDLQYRGGGEILGLKQHGGLTMRFASFPDDKSLFSETKAFISRFRPSWDEFKRGADFYFPDRESAE